MSYYLGQTNFDEFSALMLYVICAGDKLHAEKIMRDEFPTGDIDIKEIDKNFLKNAGYSSVEDFLDDLDERPTKPGAFTSILNYFKK